MSKYDARIATDQLIGRPALVSPQYATAGLGSEVTSSGMRADLVQLASADQTEEQVAYEARRQALAEAYGFDSVAPDKPFIFSNGYALIPIHGLLLNRFNWSWGFWTGYNFLRSQVAAAVDDPDVNAIIFDVNSPGGMVAGCQETADLFFANNAANGGKTMIAVVDANCHSAAYYLASQCDHVAVTPSGNVGSIGVVMLHCDMSQMFSDFGIKFTFIVAGAHKVDGNPLEPLSEDVRADFQGEIDAMYDTFVVAVVRGRGLSDEAVRATEARCYNASDAFSEDLVDDIQNPADAVEAYFFPCEDEADPDDDDGAGDDEDDDPPDPEESHMAQRPAPTPQARQTPPAQAAAAATDQEVTSVDVNQVSTDARAAERTRIQGIQGHTEATGRESLAAYLALETDMSVEAAGKILAASPKAVAAPVADPKATPEQTHFQRAMATGTHPNVGAGAEGSGGEGGDDTVPPANRILATQKRFGVVTPIRDAK